ncbi:hypothetical protein HWV62_9771 [Athelia sp. TMB]|nr:hypothetical protein HWV62_29761 [Athelia sp. TMB]KAF7975333.1 hypothetical protein HWV62_9771 [Athelia sp. TMB]
MPLVISAALGIDQSQVMTLYLQVYEPATYTSIADVDQLATMYIAYIPSDDVATLASLIKVKDSAFYTSTNTIAAQLAAQVDSSFAINSVSTSSGSGSGGSAGGNTSSSSAASKTRQDAIIGVVSALGAIALAILGLLLYRGWKRRQELVHQRLTDADDLGARPEGRDFDRDSLGGQRRRSFYYAEDSLSGGQAQASDDHYDYRTSPDGNMRERRPILPGTISTPYLQQSSMNW